MINQLYLFDCDLQFIIFDGHTLDFQCSPQANLRGWPTLLTSEATLFEFLPPSLNFWAPLFKTHVNLLNFMAPPAKNYLNLSMAKLILCKWGQYCLTFTNKYSKNHKAKCSFTLAPF